MHFNWTLWPPNRKQRHVVAEGKRRRKVEWTDEERGKRRLRRTPMEIPFPKERREGRFVCISIAARDRRRRKVSALVPALHRYTALFIQSFARFER